LCFYDELLPLKEVEELCPKFLFPLKLSSTPSINPGLLGKEGGIDTGV